MTIRIVHALPNSWFPIPGAKVTMAGLTAAQVSEICHRHEVISHVRYPDHAENISKELGVDLPVGVENAPSPAGSADTFIVASRRFDGGIDYVHVWDANPDYAELEFLHEQSF
jgi:hypothetical protein